MCSVSTQTSAFNQCFTTWLNSSRNTSLLRWHLCTTVHARLGNIKLPTVVTSWIWTRTGCVICRGTTYWYNATPCSRTGKEAPDHSELATWLFAAQNVFSQKQRLWAGLNAWVRHQRLPLDPRKKYVGPKNVRTQSWRCSCIILSNVIEWRTHEYQFANQSSNENDFVSWMIGPIVPLVVGVVFHLVMFFFITIINKVTCHQVVV